MKKSMLLLLIGISVFFLTACKSDTTIKIGFSNVLTTSYGNLGIDAMYGAQLAVQEINDNGGVNGNKLELIVRDDEGDPIKAIEVDNELKELDCVAIIGHGLSGVAEATINNANDRDILLISPTITSTVFNGLDDNFFRIIPAVNQQGETIANLVYETNPEDTLVFYESRNSAFSFPLTEAFTVQSELNGLIINESNKYIFTGNDSDEYSRISSIINNESINNVLIIGSSYDVSSIVQQLDRDVNIYLSLWASTSDLIQLSGSNIEGARTLNFYDTFNTGVKYLDFVDSYTERYGVNPSFSSMFAYEAVYILAEALENTTNYSVDAIKEALLDIDEFEGLMDTIAFNQFGDIEREIYSFIVEDGEYVKMEDEVN